MCHFPLQKHVQGKKSTHTHTLHLSQNSRSTLGSAAQRPRSHPLQGQAHSRGSATHLRTACSASSVPTKKKCGGAPARTRPACMLPRARGRITGNDARTPQCPWAPRWSSVWSLWGVRTPTRGLPAPCPPAQPARASWWTASRSPLSPCPWRSWRA